MIPAILMAAGASSRMGRPKALLRVGDRSFVRHILETLQRGGVHEAVVVINSEGDAIREEVESAGFGRIVVNSRANEGQLSSLIAGLDAIDRDGVDAALVTLVDVPLIQASTIRQLLARAAASPAPILRAVHRGRHGHPVIFKRQLFDALRHADPALGAKAVVRAAPVEDVDVDDPAVVEDVDTPDDYARISRIFGLPEGLAEQAGKLKWYHTVELPGGVTTPGIYDHRPYLPFYGLPPDLHGMSVLDVGAASGFFTFELERRGGALTATDLPTWKSHDLGAQYRPDLGGDRADEYLHEPFLFAHRARGSRAARKLTSIYDIAPETTGVFDLVFCGSVLIHLSDPAAALRRLQSVTRQAAIISTVVHPLDSPDPVALFSGHLRGGTWWAPNRAAFEALVSSAGFAGWEWYSEFPLDYADGTAGPYHAVIRAWNTPERPAMLAAAGPSPRPPRPAPRSWEDRLSAQERESSRLHGVIDGYKAMKFVRLVEWLHPYRERLRRWFG